MLVLAKNLSNEAMRRLKNAIKEIEAIKRLMLHRFSSPAMFAQGMCQE
jgi:hypothetical protein